MYSFTRALHPHSRALRTARGRRGRDVVVDRRVARDPPRADAIRGVARARPRVPRIRGAVGASIASDVPRKRSRRRRGRGGRVREAQGRVAEGQRRGRALVEGHPVRRALVRGEEVRGRRRGDRARGRVRSKRRTHPGVSRDVRGPDRPRAQAETPRGGDRDAPGARGVPHARTQAEGVPAGGVLRGRAPANVRLRDGRRRDARRRSRVHSRAQRPRRARPRVRARRRGRRRPGRRRAGGAVEPVRVHDAPGADAVPLRRGRAEGEERRDGRRRRRRVGRVLYTGPHTTAFAW